MSANLGSSSGQEVELNITPIIDCFTVLITFLLASASFLSIGFFEVYTPGNSTDASNSTQPDMEVILRVGSNQSVEMKLKGKKTGTTHYVVNEPKELEKMVHIIDGIKAEKLTLNQILITADNDVPYSNIAKVMDSLQKSDIPVVMGDL